MSGASECEAVRSQWRISYFSLSRYSSLPGLVGSVFAELVGGTVDAVVGGECRGEDDALHERWAAALLQGGVEDVGGVGPEVGAEEVADRRLRDLFEVLLELGLGVAPGEVGVGLGEAGLGEGVHDVRAGEGFGEEDGVGVVLVDVGDAPLPEGQGLGVRVVDAEDLDAVVDPELEDGEELFPEAAPVGGLEVERVDVLVLLGRVFGVLDGAVGTMEEPVRDVR